MNHVNGVLTWQEVASHAVRLKSFIHSQAHYNRSGLLFLLKIMDIERQPAPMVTGSMPVGAKHEHPAALRWHNTQ